MIPAIGLASGIGGRKLGAGEGPLFVRKHFNEDLLWETMVMPEIGRIGDPCEAIASLNQKFAEAAYSMAQREPFFLSVGGDHSCAIGMWSGVAAAKKQEGNLGLIWIDAHMDSHTPQTSETGNIHGMPLAALLGYGDERLKHILYPHPKLQPQNIALIGIRSFESGELELLQRLNVRVYFMEEVNERGLDAVMREAHALVTSDTVGYGISFDLDSIDPAHIAAVGTPVPGGLDPEEVLNAFSLFEERPPLAFELVEYNPSLDDGFRTLRFIRRLISKIKLAAVLPARS